MAGKRDPYELLGVDRGADGAEIKKAFRRVARELHPDVNKDDPGAEERFKEVAEAYEILSDPERRRTYDAFGHEGLRSGGFRPRSEGFGTVADIFDAFFGGEGGFGDVFGRTARGPAGGGDIAVAIEIELADVLVGARHEVEFEAVVPCERCRGNGAEPGTPIHTCEACGGVGQIQQVTRTAFGQMMRTGACPTCQGEGKVPESPCEVCAGRGREVSARSWEVEIPAGIEHGQRIRISGAGHAGEPGGPSGDLYVQVAVRPDRRFVREGRDLLTVVEVPVTTAMLGAELEVPTLEGSEPVEVPAGAQHGETIRLRERGLPSLDEARRGDLHAVLKLVTPVKLDDEQRELAERLDATLAERNEPGGDGLFERVRRAFR